MTTEHRGHKILGHWCWDCQVKVKGGIPGWRIPFHGPKAHYSIWDKSALTGKGYCTSIVWMNKDNATNRPCALCERYCNYPVEHRFSTDYDGYKLIRKKGKEFD